MRLPPGKLVNLDGALWRVAVEPHAGRVRLHNDDRNKTVRLDRLGLKTLDRYLVGALVRLTEDVKTRGDLIYLKDQVFTVNTTSRGVFDLCVDNPRRCIRNVSRHSFELCEEIEP